MTTRRWSCAASKKAPKVAAGCSLAGPNYGTFWTARPPGEIRKSSDSSGCWVSAVSRRTSTRNSIPSSMPSMRSATASATSSGRSAEIGCRWAIKAASSSCPIARSPRRPAMRLRGMRNAERGTGNGEKADGKCQMTDGKCRMADDRGQMVDDECEVRSGGCGNGESGQPTPEASQSAIVGYDSNRVIDDSTNDKIGILSHEGMNPTDRPYQGACDRQSLPSGVKTPRNVQNEANLELTQSSLPLWVKSYSTEPAGRKRSQSAAGSTVPHDAGNDPFDPIATAREGKEGAWGTMSIKPAV